MVGPLGAADWSRGEIFLPTNTPIPNETAAMRTENAIPPAFMTIDIEPAAAVLFNFNFSDSIVVGYPDCVAPGTVLLQSRRTITMPSLGVYTNADNAPLVWSVTTVRLGSIAGLQVAHSADCLYAKAKIDSAFMKSCEKPAFPGSAEAGVFRAYGSGFRTSAGSAAVPLVD